jgi:hypothetical protein
MKIKYNMKVFVKLNIISAFYALVLFIQLQPMLNIYRLVRITDWSFGTIYMLVAIFNLFVFIISTIVFLFITRKYLRQGNLRFLLTLLWIPFYAIITLIFYSLFPITIRGEEPAPVLGLVFIGVFFIYPFYIAFLNIISSKDI